MARAHARRAAVAAQGTNAYRALHGDAEGAPDVTVDRFADVAVVSLYRPLSEPQERAWAEAAAQALPVRAVYLKRRPKQARQSNAHQAALAPEQPVLGVSVPELVALENGVRFRIRPGQGLSVGLYLDMRNIRAWVRDNLKGRMLNCFAYTCGFGVAAAATDAVHVDLSRRVLDWGKENHALNGIPSEGVRFVAADVPEYLTRLARKQEAFDLVILDPPSFSSSKRGVFSAQRDYPALAALAARVVRPGGRLLTCCNLALWSAARFEKAVTAALPRPSRASALVPSPLDFPGGKGEPALKVLLYEL